MKIFALFFYNGNFFNLNIRPIKPEPKDESEQIKTMIHRFMREGYRNPSLTSTPTYIRNRVELQDVKKLKQNGKVLEYELDQLLAMMETAR